MFGSDSRGARGAFYSQSSNRSIDLQANTARATALQSRYDLLYFRDICFFAEHTTHASVIPSSGVANAEGNGDACISGGSRGVGDSDAIGGKGVVTGSGVFKKNNRLWA